MREFEEFFKMDGSNNHGTTVLKGKDITVDISIDFLEAVKGITKHLQFARNDMCITCKGKQTAGQEQVCKACDGTGEIKGKMDGIDVEMDCEQCEGSGQDSSGCLTCKGSGALRKTVKESIKIPKGVSTGINLRMAKKGNWSKSGKQGDLLIKITVRDHNYFKRQGDDIITEKFITVTQAILGTKVSVATLHGDYDLEIK